MKTKLCACLMSCFLAGSLFATGCGGSQQAPEGPKESASAPAPVTTAPGVPSAAPESASAAPAEAAPSAAAPGASAAPAGSKPGWEEMTIEQKKEHMKTVVLPTMKGVFAELDAKRYADMSCVTCHGAGAKQGKFDMPNPALPKLDPTGDFAKHMKKTPKIAKFMMEKVSPEMAKALGLPPYDPKTNQGFGCFDCHTMAGAK